MQIEFIGGPKDGHKEKIADPPREIGVPVKIKDKSDDDTTTVNYMKKIYRFDVAFKAYIWEDLKWPI